MQFPRMLARLILAAVLTAPGAGPAFAQADQPPGGQVFPNPAPLGPGVPREDLLEVMIKAALMTFNDANLTGNYAVLNARLHPEFRQQAPADRLATIFEGFRTNKINIAPALAHKAVFTEAPSLDAMGLLVAKGQMETRPWRTTFDLNWRREGDQWLLWKVNVRVVPTQ